ncbi:uncharacterized protein LOC123642080 [Lemur catta]|uniref:uncharacterized protein LOC123642080 n=1 Tax=Lemur catta TaxID=9447 RepID=UPI001E26D135|nr:uncharacterized protein LOC123642080 [Lemur catta]
MLAEERGERGFSPGSLRLPPPFPSGTSRNCSLGVASQLPGCNSYLTALAWSVGRASGGRALLPRGCPGRARAPPATARARAPSPGLRGRGRRTGTRAWDPAAREFPGGAERCRGSQETSRAWGRQTRSSSDGRGQPVILGPQACTFRLRVWPLPSWSKTVTRAAAIILVLQEEDKGRDEENTKGMYHLSLEESCQKLPYNTSASISLVYLARVKEHRPQVRMKRNEEKKQRASAEHLSGSDSLAIP